MDNMKHFLSEGTATQRLSSQARTRVYDSGGGKRCSPLLRTENLDTQLLSAYTQKLLEMEECTLYFELMTFKNGWQ